MNKFFSKIIAVIAAAAMAISPAAVLAEETSVPSSSDSAAVYIYNVEPATATVTAYQIISATYNSSGLVGYTVTDDSFSIADINGDSPAEGAVYITAAEAATIEQQILNGDVAVGEDGISSSVLSYSEDNEAFTGSLSAGTWLIVITNSDGYVYNPIIVSNYYTDANDSQSLTSGSVDADGNFTTGTDDDAASYYAKKSTTSIDKVVADSSDLGKDDGVDETVTASSNASDVAIGDTVTFTITTYVPEYSSLYPSVTFTLTDTMSKGLTFNNDISITTGDNETLTAYNSENSDGQDYQYSVSTSADDNENTVITITFNSDWVLADEDEDGVKDNANQELIITYTATLNSDAALNEEGNENNVVLTYTNAYTVNDDGTYNPDGSTEEIEDTVFVYTFATEDEMGKTTTSGSASDDDEDGVYEYSNALSGAVFTLYTDSDLTTVATKTVDGEEVEQTATTDDNGYIIFTGLDAGTYYMKETTAPEGYSLNDTVYTVVVSATYNEDGTIASYSINVTPSTTSESNENTYAYGDTTSISQTPTVIMDTQLSVLPSTGGMGVIMIVLACAAIGLGVAFVVTRKQPKNAAV